MNKKTKSPSVPDTAFIVAYFRAQESLKKEPLFYDPLAKKLSGAKGKKLISSLGLSKKQRDLFSWMLVIRTWSIDRLIMDAIKDGADTVINLGAGLDTRPYRMKLPSSLRWIEIDFADIIDFKSKILKSKTPACRLEYIAADLSKRNARKEIFSKISSESKKAVVLTEGLISYLSNNEAKKLSEDLFRVPQFKYWIQEYTVNDRSGGPGPFKFNCKDQVNFFTKQGWEFDDVIFAMEEGKRVGRPYPIKLPPPLFAAMKLREGFLIYRKPNRRRKAPRLSGL